MKLDITYFGLVEWLGLAFGVYILSALRINKRVLYNNGVRDLSLIHISEPTRH